MNPALAALLDSYGGVVERTIAKEVVSRWVVDYAVRTGRLAAPYPRILIRRDATDPAVHLRAALLSVGPAAALSHLSALAMWGLRPADGSVHVMTGPERRIRVAGIVAHRRAGFRSEPPIVLVRRGLPVTNLDRTLVDCWPLLSGPDQRAPIIAAVSDRRTTPTRLRHLLNEAAHLTGRAALYALLEKLQAGCRSELELWGYGRVFTGPGMPILRRQYPVRLGGRTVYLDVFAENERTNFELDGSTWHGSAEQRERDLRRDAGLAATGILVVRFTHDRLTCEPDAVRCDVLRILAARR